MVIPTVYGFDEQHAYVHGSVASQSLAADTAEVCLTITIVDGLVLARSVFEHAVNYRSAMIYARPRIVADPAEKLAGLRLRLRAPGAGPVGLRAPAQPQGAGGDPAACALAGRGFSEGADGTAGRRRQPRR